MRIHQRIDGLLVPTRERAKVAMGLRNAFNAASKEAWRVTGNYFHENMRDDRFTPEHAIKAGYYKRKGQNYRPSMKVFGQYYYGRKWLSAKHGGGKGKANPLEFSGDTRRAVRTARIEATRYGVRVIYAGARVFNFRHPKSRIRMNEEFTRLTMDEQRKLAEVYDAELDRLWKGPK